MKSDTFKLLLADDDHDDCLFFQEALEELPIRTDFTAVHDGDQLMGLLNKTVELPQVLFLDLNMPCKNGFQCLLEIKRSEQLKNLPVIIFSTSLEEQLANLLYQNGAHYYIRKPVEFSELKNVIQQVITLISQPTISQPEKQHFILKGAGKLQRHESKKN